MFLTAVVPQAVKQANAVSAPVDPDRVSNLASAVICGFCDTAATGRWLQQHLDAALLLVSCVPASNRIPVLLQACHTAGTTVITVFLCCISSSSRCRRRQRVAAHGVGKCVYRRAFRWQARSPRPASVSTRIVQEVIYWLRCNLGPLSMPRTPALLPHLQRQLPARVAVLLYLNSRESRCEILAVYVPLASFVRPDQRRRCFRCRLDVVVAATLELTYHRSSRTRAMSCGATSQRAWITLQKKKVLRQTLHTSCRTIPLHRHRSLQFLVDHSLGARQQNDDPKKSLHAHRGCSLQINVNSKYTLVCFISMQK